jgi:hypothetical protein
MKAKLKMLDNTLIASDANADTSATADVGQFLSYFARYAEPMTRRGWPAVPIVTPGPETNAGKRPGTRIGGSMVALDNWQVLADRLLIPADIATYTGPNVDAGIGVPCGGAFGVIGVDIDCEPLADQIQALAFEIIGPTRFIRSRGNERRLLAYAAFEAMSKVEIPKVIEILGTGQQFVAAGVHPVTGIEYRWLDLSPWTAGISQLPTIRLEQRAKFMLAVEALCKRNGVATTKANTDERAPAVRHDTATVSIERLKALLDALPSDWRYHDWRKVCFAIHTEGGNFDLWDAWSKRDARYDALATRDKWLNACKTNRREIGAGTICKMLIDRGIEIPDVDHGVDVSAVFAPRQSATVPDHPRKIVRGHIVEHDGIGWRIVGVAS